MIGRIFTVCAAFILPFLSLYIGCTDKSVNDRNDSTMKISKDLLKKVSQKNIYFGHQSVGFNIIEGMRDIMRRENGISLSIIETEDPSKTASPSFFHSRIGENRNPLSKIEHFEKLMDRGFGRVVDIAFFKLCYVDISADTDVERIFNKYRETMDRLGTRYEGVKFIHWTVPLTTIETGVKSLIKRLSGMEIKGERENLNRSRFNTLLRKEYSRSNRIFDLADIESTFPSGKKAVFGSGDSKSEYLVPSYTFDGGHLNEKGRRLVAEKLLIYLAGMIE